MRPTDLQALLQQLRGMEPRALLLFASALLAQALAALTDSPPPAAATTDVMLTAVEAAPITGMSARWLYEHADELPFARRTGKRAVRFSKAGALEWIEKRGRR